MLDYTPPIGWDFPMIEEIASAGKGAIRIGPFGSALKKHEYSDVIRPVIPKESDH